MIKKKSDEKKEYKQEDFIKVIVNRDSEKPMKNSQVREALVKLDKKRYNNISAEWVKQMLIKLERDDLISGGKDPDFGIYLWNKKEVNDGKK